MHTNKNNSKILASLLLVLCAVSTIMPQGSAAGGTFPNALDADRADSFQNAAAAADAATEKLFAQFSHDCLLNGESVVSTNLAAYQSLVPTAADDPNWGSYSFTQPTNGLPGTWVGLISPFQSYAPVSGQFGDLPGFRSTYRIASNARLNAGPASVTAGVWQDVAVEYVPVFEFAIYYKSLLELTWAPPAIIRGHTHSDSDIYVGSPSNLSFSNLVTTAGSILAPPWDSHTTNEYTGPIYYGGAPTPGYVTGEPAFVLPVGANNSTTNLHAIIDQPSPSEDVSSALGRQRFYNEAGMVILVSNASVTITLKSAPNDGAPATISNWNGLTNGTGAWLTLTNSFSDARENGKTVKCTQIDVGKFTTWMRTNINVTNKFSQSVPLKIVYAADYRSGSSSVLRALRLTNGTVLPTNGLTIATPGPLYVLGNYNCPNPAYLGTTNTTASVPASFVCDALTILSSNWRDPNSTASLGVRSATSTTINAAMIAGVVYSTTGTATGYSGGLVNQPRLLENWNTSSTVLTLNTSMVNLFSSTWATNQFLNPGTYYNAPTRNFNFDPSFLDSAKLPPGTPMLLLIERVGRGMIPQP